MSNYVYKAAPNNPPHLFIADSFYMLTASTHHGVALIHSNQRKEEWRDAFLKAAKNYEWLVIAWVVLENHYHALVKAPANAENLPRFINSFHKFTARIWNDADDMNGRKVWWNYWDTSIRSETDYFSRLRYIFWNPVKHGLVEKPEDYPYSNYLEFTRQWSVDLIDIYEAENVPEF